MPPAPGLGRIIVPLDGSPEGESALPFLPRLATSAATRITLLHVLTPALERGRGAAYGSLQAERARLRAYLEGVAAALDRQGLPARVRLRTGDAADQIVACAGEEQADLIAMTTHGRSGLRRALLGSVAEAVVRCSRKTPVLLVRARRPARPRGPRGGSPP